MKKNLFLFFAALIIAVAPLAAALGEDRPKLEIIDSGLRFLGESPGGAYLDYSWQMTVQNHTERDRRIAVKIVMLDEEGFQLESATSRGVAEAKNSTTFRDTGIIKKSLAQEITEYTVSMRNYGR